VNHPGAGSLRLSGLRTVVPGSGLPADVPVGRSNNNLDVVDFAGRRWLAWRSARSHFASADARIEVVSSTDLGVTWEHETTIALDRDIREPRFFVWDGRLLLYAFEGGTNPRRFEPGRILVVEQWVDDGWTAPSFISPPGCVVWRVRLIGGRPVMSLYRGAETLFTAHPEPLTVELWTTDDGFAWGPIDPDRAVLVPGGTETELLELADGRVLYVCRKEGPDDGWGTDIGIAPAHDLLDVTWRSLPGKCDSPLLVRHCSGVRLITRRQLAFSGRFDQGWTRGSNLLRTRAYQASYSLTRKRTAVYDVDLPDEPGAGLGLTHLGDLPSRGDTAFAAVVDADGGDPVEADRWTIFNYTSPLDGPDLPWLASQLRTTQIVAVDVDL